MAADLAYPSRTLGIDFGSTSTRAVLLRHDNDAIVNVENTANGSLNARFKSYDFPSTAFPFEENPCVKRKRVYINPGCPERRGISAKYFMYALVGLRDEILDWYPLAKDLV